MRNKKTFRKRLYEIIFESETPAGKIFDVSLLILITISILLIFLESIPSINEGWSHLFLRLDFFITAIFTVEYLLRLYSTPKPISYAKSFYGIIDLLAILPSILSLLVPDMHLSLIHI